jgi:hypothetical protein
MTADELAEFVEKASETPEVVAYFKAHYDWTMRMGGGLPRMSEDACRVFKGLASPTMDRNPEPGM